MKVVILQGILPHYRLPFFDAIGQHPSITSLEVVHSGQHTPSQERSFIETVVTTKSCISLIWQNFPSSIWKADVVVAMSDMHWVRSWFLPWRKPTIFWGGYGRNRLFHPLRTYLAHKCQALILYSEKEKNDLLQKGIPSQKLFVAHNTISVPNASIDISQQRKTFLFVGRLEPRKRVDELLSAFAQLPILLQKNLVIEIVGDGTERTKLEQITHDLGIYGQVFFHGTVHQEERLREIFGRSIAYVSPGPVGLGLLHSFAYGVPVILNEETWHGPEIENLNPGYNGWFYQNATNGLAKKITEVIENEKQWCQNSIQAYHTYQNCNMKNMVNTFIKALQFAYTISLPDTRNCQ